ncbi:MAG: ZIP family metal transporter [Burkholderiales bacterium]|nr:ZIP family metal transporter [Burkholderiales bacterium]
MSTLGYIILASLVGAVLSIVCAAALSFAAPQRWIGALVSVAIGALLGAAFLEILPHAFEAAGDVHAVAATVLGGILVFFLLEKLVLWRHFHIGDDESPAAGTRDRAHASAHGGHDHGRSGTLILIGDSFHNFVDGVLIAAAFIESPALGAVTATAVIAHEIPQEVGDFLILLHSGFSRTRAFVLNLATSLAMFVGALGAYFALQQLQGWINTLLALAAASMIYVAVADLIPSLHRRTELRATAQQVLLIGLGVLMIWLAGELAHGG